nr:MAG TPA: ATP synthase B/B' [Caudoviricetes sp.]
MIYPFRSPIYSIYLLIWLRLLNFFVLFLILYSCYNFKK